MWPAQQLSGAGLQGGAGQREQRRDPAGFPRALSEKGGIARLCVWGSCRPVACRWGRRPRDGFGQEETRGGRESRAGLWKALGAVVAALKGPLCLGTGRGQNRVWGPGSGTAGGDVGHRETFLPAVGSCGDGSVEESRCLPSSLVRVMPTPADCAPGDQRRLARLRRGPARLASG